MSDHNRPSDDRIDYEIPEPPVREQWVSPRLTFVEPTLTKQGDIKEITGYGLFGTFDWDGGS